MSFQMGLNVGVPRGQSMSKANQSEQIIPGHRKISSATSLGLELSQELQLLNSWEADALSIGAVQK